jgi:hypothetical protein
MRLILRLTHEWTLGISVFLYDLVLNITHVRVFHPSNQLRKPEMLIDDRVCDLFFNGNHSNALY